MPNNKIPVFVPRTYEEMLADLSDTKACDCGSDGCSQCNRLMSEDVICAECGEHAELRENTGTECCNAKGREYE